MNKDNKEDRRKTTTDNDISHQETDQRVNVDNSEKPNNRMMTMLTFLKKT